MYEFDTDGGRPMVSPQEDYEHDPFGGTGFKKSVEDLEKEKPKVSELPKEKLGPITFDLSQFSKPKEKGFPVKLNRLLTGEELVGETEPVDGGYCINKPLIFMTQPQPGGKIKAGLVPWMPYTKASESRVFFKAEHVIVSLDPAPEIVTAWKSLTSGLTIATKPNLIVP